VSRHLSARPLQPRGDSPLLHSRPARAHKTQWQHHSRFGHTTSLTATPPPAHYKPGPTHTEREASTLHPRPYLQPQSSTTRRGDTRHPPHPTRHACRERSARGRYSSSIVRRLPATRRGTCGVPTHRALPRPILRSTRVGRETGSPLQSRPMVPCGRRLSLPEETAPVGLIPRAREDGLGVETRDSNYGLLPSYGGRRK